MRAADPTRPVAGSGQKIFFLKKTLKHLTRMRISAPRRATRIEWMIQRHAKLGHPDYSSERPKNAEEPEG
jgi:hypothetical protein